MKRLSPEIQRSIKQLEIKTRRILRSSQLNERLTPLRGSGFEFDQLRDYSPGDDIRYIDWNAYARTDSLLVKQYKEERNRSVVVAMDISHSTVFGTTRYMKREYNNIVAAMLSMATYHAGDTISLIQFSSIIEGFFPFNNQRSNIYKLIESIYLQQSTTQGTSLTTLANFLMRLKKKSVVLLLSDFIDQSDFSVVLKQVAQKHEIIAVRITDIAEQKLPAMGFITIEDIETGQLAELDTRKWLYLQTILQERLYVQKKELQKIGVKVVDLIGTTASVDTFIKIFCKQMRY